MSGIKLEAAAVVNPYFSSSLHALIKLKEKAGKTVGEAVIPISQLFHRKLPAHCTSSVSSSQTSHNPMSFFMGGSSIISHSIQLPMSLGGVWEGTLHMKIGIRKKKFPHKKVTYRDLVRVGRKGLGDR